MSSASTVETVMASIKDRSLKVGILGLGYVGLPLACCFGQAGFNVLGLDVSERVVKLRSEGSGAGSDVTDEELSKLVDAGLLKFSTDFSGIKDCGAAIMCVPTPLSKYKTPDLSYIISAMGMVTQHMSKGCIIVLESTTYPGCTREIIGKAVEEAGFVIGEDVFLCFSPERVDPGNPDFDTSKIPKVMGGMTPNCLKTATALYENVVVEVVPVDRPEEAEMVKLLENTFRAVNIAMVNELTQMANRMGVNMWNVIRAAKTKPFGFMAFTPGPGIGGHCIPLDPQYLSFMAKTFHHYNRFIELASDVNENMPEFVINRLVRILNKEKVCANGANVLLVGLAYKKNVADTRESPSLFLIRMMEEIGIHVDYHDPFVPTYTHKNFTSREMKNVEFTPENINKYDAVLISTDHDSIDWAGLVANSKRIFDTRNAIASRGVADPEKKVTVL